MTGRLLGFLGNALFMLVTLLIGGVILALTVLPPLLRYQTYVVLSGSMEPAIKTGSVIVATAVAPEALQIGDVVTFARPGDQENVTHRVVGIQTDVSGQRSFITRGDANNTDDQSQIRYDRLAGKVTMTVPYLGYAFKFIGSPSMRVMFIVVPGILLLAMWLWEVWRPEPKPKPATEPATVAATRGTPSPQAGKRRTLDVSGAPDAATIPLRQ